MPFIEVIAPESASGRLQRIYGLVAAPNGQVDNVLQVHSLRPHSLEGHMALYKAVLHHTGNQLPVWFLEAIGVLVSRLNGCAYCAEHHAVGMRRMLADEAASAGYEAALAQSAPGAPFSAAEQAALAYAGKLTRDPGGIRQADIDAMRSAGFDDGQILEVNQVAAYFAYANRTVSGLGVDTGGEELGLSPDEGEALDEWGHG
jgi:uncharacterized peroxidase-related enzyme